MKVLLVTDIKRLGWLGDVVEVSEGYARNYLLPQGLANVVTEANLKAIAEEKKRRAEQRKLGRERLEEVAAAVEGAEAVLAAKASATGRLFGSVTPSDIAGNLREQGFEVPDDVVAMGGHIKEVGTHSVSLKFAPDLAATVSVVVVPLGLPAQAGGGDVAAGESRPSASPSEGRASGEGLDEDITSPKEPEQARQTDGGQGGENEPTDQDK